jgi:general secretion pathway protein K
MSRSPPESPSLPAPHQRIGDSLCVACGPRRQRGAAVLVAMLVVAIAALAASSFMFRSQVEWRRLENLIRIDQARLVTDAAQQWGATVLRDDARNSAVDHRGEIWATRLPPVEAEGYRMWGTMEDLEGRFNLNNLVRNGEPDRQQLDILVRLLRSLRLPDSLAFAIADWIDVDDLPLDPRGAESEYYAGLATPYRAANHPLVSVNELLRVKGIDRSVLAALRPYVTALPAATPINVNTASPEVLAALVPGLSSEEAYAMVARRERVYYRNVEDFRRALPGGIVAPATGIAVSSQYFLVQARARNERLAIGSQALYRRDGPGQPRLVWRAEL